MSTVTTHERTVTQTVPTVVPEHRGGAPESFVARHARRALAGSGFLMLAFVLVHLAGNLLAFAGAVALNSYARGLRELGIPILPESGFLWVVRVGLAAVLIVHLAAHLYLMRHPDAPSNPVLGPAGEMPPWYATLPVTVFQVSGALILLFVAFHLAQLTVGAIHPAFVVGDAYDNTLIALRSWPAAVAYIGVAMAVGIHLLPGTWTGMRSLGLIRPDTLGLARTLPPIVSVVVIIGLSVVPAAVLLGVLR